MKTENSQQFRQQGFTLIELIVSISIMVLLVSVIAANFNGASTSSQRNVLLGSNNLVSDLHKMQSYSLSSRNISTISGQINPAASYSISFAAGAATYAWNSQDKYQNTSTTNTVNLPANIKINAIQITTPTTTVNPSQATVSFSVPYSRITATYTGNSTPENNDIIRLQVSSTVTSICEYVYVNGITGNINTNATCP